MCNQRQEPFGMIFLEPWIGNFRGRDSQIYITRSRKRRCPCLHLGYKEDTIFLNTNGNWASHPALVQPSPPTWTFIFPILSGKGNSQAAFPRCFVVSILWLYILTLPFQKTRAQRGRIASTKFPWLKILPLCRDEFCYRHSLRCSQALLPLGRNEVQFISHSPPVRISVPT